MLSQTAANAETQAISTSGVVAVCEVISKKSGKVLEKRQVALLYTTGVHEAGFQFRTTGKRDDPASPILSAEGTTYSGSLAFDERRKDVAYFHRADGSSLTLAHEYIEAVLSNEKVPFFIRCRGDN